MCGTVRAEKDGELVFGGGATTGTEIVVKDESSSGGCITVLVGLVFVAVGAAGVVLVLAGSDLTRTPVLLVSALLPGVFGLIGVALLAWQARGGWRHRVLGAASLTLPGAEPLTLGGAVTARFRRAGGSRRPRGPARLAAHLICVEKATYRQGTDTHTATREVRRRELSVWVDPVAEPVTGRVRIEVPVDAPPSMALTHNEIVWSVRVEVQVAGLPDGSATFPVTVLPVVVPGAEAELR